MLKSVYDLLRAAESELRELLNYNSRSVAIAKLGEVEG